MGEGPSRLLQAAGQTAAVSKILATSTPSLQNAELQRLHLQISARYMRRFVSTNFEQ